MWRAAGRGVLPAFSYWRNLYYMSTGGEGSSANSAAERIPGGFTGRMPGDWFAGVPEIGLDREEISVVGVLPVPEVSEDMTDAERAAAAEGRSRRFREQTRQQRIEIAREAEHRFGRKVSWGVICNNKKVMFTSFSVPVMTRLRQPERLVLDTLVDAGGARRPREAPPRWGAGGGGGG